MRLLSQNSLRYRRQILALKSFFAGRRCTVILLDDLSSNDHDLQLHSIANGVITLEQLSLDYGAERRRLRVVKMRGMKFRGGYHDLTIETGGLAIYPRLVAAEHHKAFLGELTSTGSAELDAPAWRRCRARDEPVADWRRRGRQVVNRVDLRNGGGGPRRSGCRVRL